MTDGTQVRRSPNNQSSRVICGVLVVALVVIVAIFCYLAFAHQAHDGHGQADPNKQSLVMLPHARAA